MPIAQPGATCDASRAPHSGLPELLQRGQEPLRRGREPAACATRTLSGSSPSPASRPRRRGQGHLRRLPGPQPLPRSRGQGGRRARPGSRGLRRPRLGRAQPAARQPLPRAQRLPAGPRAGRAGPPARERGRAAAGRPPARHPRDALKAAFAQWGLPPLERRVGWQPNRFLSDRTEGERTFALAERLGSGNAAAAELGATWRRCA